jgi:spore coat polysaccharide biosynthesis protein SpsF
VAGNDSPQAAGTVGLKGMSKTIPIIVAIIQARMGSTRLPGKVLKDLEGETVLARVLARVKRAATIGHIIVATSDAAGDDVIVAECKRLSTRVFRGGAQDVLDRYYRGAQLFKAEVVVRITADCPLIDPELVDETVKRFLDELPDYASNALVRTYPRGLDTEVFTLRALERAWSESSDPYQRAHVTPFIYQNPKRFKVLAVKGEKDYSSLRWTLDTPEDLEFLRAVYARFPERDDFGWLEVLSLLEREPHLLDLNRNVVQKDLHEG